MLVANDFTSSTDKSKGSLFSSPNKASPFASTPPAMIVRRLRSLSRMVLAAPASFSVQSLAVTSKASTTRFPTSICTSPADRLLLSEAFRFFVSTRYDASPCCSTSACRSAAIENCSYAPADGVAYSRDKSALTRPKVRDPRSSVGMGRIGRAFAAIFAQQNRKVASISAAERSGSVPQSNTASNSGRFPLSSWSVFLPMF